MSEERKRVIAAVKDHRMHRKKMAIDLLGGKCAHCPHDVIEALRIDYIGGRRTLPSQNETFKAVITDPNMARTEYEVICLNCLAPKRITVHGRILKEYEDPELASLQSRSLEVFKVGILPIWGGETPLKTADILKTLNATRTRSVDRKTLYKYLQYLEAAEYIKTEKNPLDRRQKLYTVLKEQ